MIDTDPDILETLYLRYHAGTVLYCTALCGNEYLAQDIAADAFVKAYLSLPNNVPSFQYWLLRVCKNLWIDHCRQQKYLASEEPLAVISDSVTPESRYIQGEERIALNDRELVTLHYFSGLPLNEIAPLMGKSYDAVRQRMTRLRQKLRKDMEAQGYGK